MDSFAKAFSSLSLEAGPVAVIDSSDCDERLTVRSGERSRSSLPQTALKENSGVCLQYQSSDNEDSDDNSDDPDDDESLSDFERSNSWLLNIFRRDSQIIRGPRPSHNPFKTPPTEFWRVCHDGTFVQYNSDTGFVNQQKVSRKIGPGLYQEDRLDVPSWPFIDAESVLRHMDFGSQESESIALFVSMSGTETKKNRELLWRQNPRNGRRDIQVYRIDGSGMEWGCIDLNAELSLPCLFKRMWCVVYDQRAQALRTRLVDIVFLNAKEVIDRFDIQERVKPEAYNTCEDEWLAVQRVPEKIITMVESF